MPGRVTRGMIVEVNLDPTIGQDIQKKRPCVVIQNDIGTALTGAEHVRRPLPIWVLVPTGEGGIEKDSYVLCNQIRSVDGKRLGKIYGQLSRTTMEKVDQALRISLAL